MDGMEELMYLTEFHFPDSEEEFNFFMRIKRTCYDSFYPFQVLSAIGFSRMDFEPVTILYGGNGCGKSTVLNVIAGKLGLKRRTLGNSSSFFGDYLELCSYETGGRIPRESCILTSDDVFDFMLDLRTLNEGIDRKREEVFEEYLDAKYAEFHFRSMEDYDRLKQVNLARSKTQSKYVRKRLMDNVREHSNGADPGKRPVSAGRAGKQSVRGQAAGAGPIFGGFGAVFRLPAGHFHPFALPAGHAGSEDLRYERKPGGRKTLDTAGKRPDVLRLFQKT